MLLSARDSHPRICIAPMPPAHARKTRDTPDLFETAPAKRSGSYSAKDIEVLEGLEPVRRRPGMYIGGTDHAPPHHLGGPDDAALPLLAPELLENAMDEAVAGHASFIE